MNRNIALAGALCGALAVVLGAFGSHALRGVLDPAALQTWRTAVDYQFWHALALLVAGCQPASRWRTWSSVGFIGGIAAFCGSLYALALGAPHAVGLITPVGGIALIGGWLALAGAIWRTAR